MAQLDYSEELHWDNNEEHELSMEKCNINKTEPAQDLDMWTSDPSKIVTELSSDRVIRASQGEVGRPLHNDIIMITND